MPAFDLDAIRARHVPAPPVPGYPLICAYCGAAHLWRCDTAIVLAALGETNGHLGDMIAGKRIAEAALDAALARERRLRAALAEDHLREAWEAVEVKMEAKP